MRKLSDIHGEDAMELTAMLISIGREVTNDKTIKKYILGPKPQGMSTEEWNTAFATEFYNAMLLRYRKDCEKMLAKIEGVSTEEYLKEADPLKVVNDLGELMGDKDFSQLFFASAPTRVRTSGSGSENTKGPEQ